MHLETRNLFLVVSTGQRLIIKRIIGWSADNGKTMPVFYNNGQLQFINFPESADVSIIDGSELQAFLLGIAKRTHYQPEQVVCDAYFQPFQVNNVEWSSI